jgi:tRNA(fMet)-specific endonuclease VapC
MEVVLLDTNIVSFVLKGDSRCTLYTSYLEGRRLAISFMTVAELYQWTFVRNWSESRQQKLEASLQSYTVLPFDIALCRLWGEIRSRCRSEGRPISPQDAWIAATAFRFHLRLVTHNPTDFEAVEDLQILTAVA